MKNSESRRAWVYKPDESGEMQAVIIAESEVEKYKSEGWSDTPATFFKLTDHGVDPENQLDVQYVGETIEGVKNAANGALNLELMTRSELEAYGEVNFGLTFPAKYKKADILAEINDVLENGNGDSAENN